MFQNLPPPALCGIWLIDLATALFPGREWSKAQSCIGHDQSGRSEGLSSAAAPEPQFLRFPGHHDIRSFAAMPYQKWKLGVTRRRPGATTLPLTAHIECSHTGDHSTTVFQHREGGILVPRHADLVGIYCKDGLGMQWRHPHLARPELLFLEALVRVLSSCLMPLSQDTQLIGSLD